MQRKTNHFQTRLYLIIAAIGVCMLSLWPTLVAARPMTPRHQIRRAWQLANDIGVYQHRSEIIQTTHPTVRLENSGRSPKVERMVAAGSVDSVQHRMHLTLHGAANTQQMEMKIDDGLVYGRQQEADEWMQLDDVSSRLAPGNEPLGFLVAVTNIREVTSNAHEGRASNVDAFVSNPYMTQTAEHAHYAFDISGLRYAEFIRAQMETAMKKQGELPVGARLALLEQYVDMEAEGEIWLNAAGLPVRQVLHLTFPAQPNAYDWVEAEIATTFHNWDTNALEHWFVSAFRRGVHNPSMLVNDPLSLLPNIHTIDNEALQNFGMMMSSLLLLIALVIFVLTHLRSRQLYISVSLTVSMSMVVTPLLQNNRAQAFYDRQQEQQTTQEQQLADQQVESEMQAAIDSTGFDPQNNPLADRVAMVPQSLTTVQDSPRSLALAKPAADSSASVAAANMQTCALQGNPDGDCDNDGLSNFVEITKLGTDPRNKDSDGDDISDKAEVEGFNNGKQWYLNPLDRDSNGDGILDTLECPGMIDMLPNVTAAACQDTDGDTTPDLFDFDNDGDGVPDTIDLSPFEATGLFNHSDQQLTFNLTLPGSSNTTFVDFEIRPHNPDHLWYTHNVYDWPAGDTLGQHTRVHNNTFADLDIYKSMPKGDNGDLVLNPALEVEITYDSSNPTAGLPFTSTMTHTTPSAITDYSDLSWVDEAALADLGISYNQGPDATKLLLWIPLYVLSDETGDTPVAWQGRMIYQPQSGATNLGANQQVRMLWMVEALRDHCDLNDKPSDITDADWCADQANWDTATTILQTYYEDFYLTGLAVREEQGVTAAIIAEPANVGNSHYDDQLWHLADSLQHAFLQAQKKPDNQRFSVNDISTYANTWGLNGLDVTLLPFASQMDLMTIAGGRNNEILNRVFSGAAVDDAATLLLAGEDQSRTVALGDVDSQFNGNNLTIDLTAATANVNTTAVLRWAPYIYKAVVSGKN